MIPLGIIGALAIVPFLLALIFRVNAVFLFVSVCVGYFLQYSLSDDVDLALAAIIKGSDSMVFVRLALLLVPVLLSIFLLKKSAGRSLLFQIAPLALTGLLIVAVALPLLPPATEQAVYDSTYGGNIRGATDLIIASAAVANLMLMWTLFKHPKTHGKHH